MRCLSEFPIVSIIIPVYNMQKFVEEAILSVLRQTYPHIELILIDDGSTDNSLLICKQYTTNSKIQLFSQPNQGVSVARNKGIEIAKGSYIYCMDADDTIDKEFIQSSVEVALKFDSDITVVGEYFERRFPNVMALPTCAIFLKKSFLDKNSDIRYPEKIQPCEDGLFSHLLLALTDRVSLNAEGIYHYRKHNSQNHKIILQQTQKILDDIPKWLDILEKFYSEKNLFNKKSLHLALFIEHEPFARYITMPFSDMQKKQLFELIQAFYNEYIKSYITKEEMKKLGVAFRYFVKSKSYRKFDIFYNNYVKYMGLRNDIFRLKIKFKLFLINFIPYRKLRKKLREQYSTQMYNRLKL